MRIAVIVHTLNEANNIADCLATVVGHADDVLVVDMYSDDDTAAIAERRGARVLLHERIAEFDFARNWSAQQVSADWILYVDADERVPEALWPALRETLPQLDNTVAAICLPYRNYFGGRWLQCLWPGYKAAMLLRSGRFKWSAGVHEGCAIDGQVALMQANPDMALEHYSFPDFASWIRKCLLRYVPLEVTKMQRASQQFEWHDAMAGFGRGLAEFYDQRGAWRDGGQGLTYSLAGAVYNLFKALSLLESQGYDAAVPRTSAELAQAIMDGVQQQLGPQTTPASAPVPVAETPKHRETGQQQLAAWADLFKGRQRVVDIGCRQTDFLGLLRDRGIDGVGFDVDPQAVSECQSLGFEAHVGDVQQLDTLVEQVDGIHAGHVVERMTDDAARAFLSSGYRSLQPGGLLLIRTLNWDHEAVANSDFWLNYTRVRQLPLPQLAQMLEEAGFVVVGQGVEPEGMRNLYIVGHKPGTTVTQDRYL